jgi:hypothetical protein
LDYFPTQATLYSIQPQRFTASRTHKEKTMTIAIEVNCATGEVTERPLTAEELAQREADAQAEAARKHEEAVAAAEAATAKAALLAKLGITEDEAKLLLA